jgi:hypothetical protein
MIDNARNHERENFSIKYKVTTQLLFEMGISLAVQSEFPNFHYRLET